MNVPCAVCFQPTNINLDPDRFPRATVTCGRCNKNSPWVRPWGEPTREQVVDK